MHVLYKCLYRSVFRMRNATILVVRLRGTATEAIKNIVLAGIGKLVIIDSDDVAEEDLGAGFFFREEDVGKKASMRECRLPPFLLWEMDRISFRSRTLTPIVYTAPGMTESGGCQGPDRESEPTGSRTDDEAPHVVGTRVSGCIGLVR